MGQLPNFECTERAAAEVFGGSLAEYLLVDQSRPRVEHYLRQDGNQWLLTVLEGLDATLLLPSLQCELALAEVYDKVVFG